MENEGPDDCLLQSVLHVDETDDEFDLDIPPTTGNEYLRRVRQEAKECPDVVVADLDTTVFDHKQTVKLSKTSVCFPAPKGLAPCLEWQKYQVDQFVQLRQKFIQQKAVLKKNGTKLPKVPSANDAESWCRLCFGRLIKQEDGQMSLLQNGETQGGNLPLVSVMAAMGQAAIVKVLHYHVNWLEATGFTSHQGRWLYALMTGLQKPLLPEVCSTLRTLARLCSHIRATLSTNEEHQERLSELNLLICLVARYFDQTDLIDEDGS